MRTDIPDVEQGCDTEGEVTPLVGAVDESTNKARDDDDLSHKESGRDVGQGQTGGEEDREGDQREADEPLDVPHVLQITIRHIDTKVSTHGLTQIWRLAPSARNSAEMGVEPRSEAMEK